MKNAISNVLKFLAFFGVGAVILYLVYQNQNEAYMAQCALDGVPEEACSLINKVIADFRGLNYFWVFGVCAAFVFSNIMRALRWNMLLKPLLGRNPRTVNTFLTTMLGYFANLGLPRLGEVVKPVSLAGYEKISVEKVLGTIVVDRVMDVLCLLVVISIAFALEFDTLWGYLSENMPESSGGLLGSPILLGLGLTGVLSIALVFVFRRKLMQTKLFAKVVELLKGFWDGILSVKKLENPLLFVFYTLMIWVFYYVMFYMYLPAFGPTEHLGFTVALMVFVFGTFGIVIPSPGGMGSYHALVIAALALYGITGSDAFSFANFSFFATHFVNIVLGLAAVIFLPMINRNYQPAAIE
ncbi:MAG: lysylphosphatidylglycerol synthase transmembrane domain-containing protein [Bacteroidota bacterium]